MKEIGKNKCVRRQEENYCEFNYEKYYVHTHVTL